MDENLNQQNWGGMDNNQGQNRPVPPPPPPPEITLRTMQSDIESVKQSGGEMPTPKPFTPPELKKQPTMELDDLSKEEGMIKPGNGDGVIPPSEPKKSGMKAVILITVLVAVLAAAAYVGYAYVYPMFAKPAPVTTPPLSVEQLPTELPPVTETTGIPENLPTTTPEGLATSTPEMATTTPPLTEVIPPPIRKQHLSFLVSSPDATAAIFLPATSTLASLRDILIAESNNKPQTEVALKEVFFDSDLGQPVFAEVLPMFLADVASSTELSALFVEDFTTLISYDQNGAWLGLVARLRPEASLVVAKASMANLEKSANLVNLYLQNPGAKATTGFKDGSANGVATRYVAFSKTGASLNYGWTNNNFFVVSTSYNGIKAILAKLGVQ